MLTFSKRSHGQKVVSSINSEKNTSEHENTVPLLSRRHRIKKLRLRETENRSRVARENVKPSRHQGRPPRDFLQCFFLSSFYTFYCTFTILMCVWIFSFLSRVIIFRWSSSKSKLPFKTITKTKLVEKIEYCFSGGVWEF